MNFFLEIYIFSPTFWKVQVGGFVNQLIKKFWPYAFRWPSYLSREQIT